MKAKRFATVLLILFLPACALCAFSYLPSVNVEAGGDFCFPTAEYLKAQSPAPARTSLHAIAEAYPVSFSFDRFDFGLGAGLAYVSRSVKSGNSVLRPYSGWGLCMTAGYDLSSDLHLGIFSRALWLEYRPLKDSFTAVEAGIIAESVCNNGFSLGLPLTLSFKRDALTLRIGISARYTLEVAL